MGQTMNNRPDLSDNPFLKIDNPYEDASGAQEKASLKATEFGRLCYSVFHEYEDGKRLWEFLKENYLMQQQVDPTQDNAQQLSLWWDGFKASLLGMYNMGLMHIKKTNGAA